MYVLRTYIKILNNKEKHYGLRRKCTKTVQKFKKNMNFNWLIN